MVRLAGASMIEPDAFLSSLAFTGVHCGSITE